MKKICLEHCLCCLGNLQSTQCTYFNFPRPDIQKRLLIVAVSLRTHHINITVSKVFVFNPLKIDMIQEQIMMMMGNFVASLKKPGWVKQFSCHYLLRNIYVCGFCFLFFRQLFYVTEPLI